MSETKEVKIFRMTLDAYDCLGEYIGIDERNNLIKENPIMSNNEEQFDNFWLGVAKKINEPNSIGLYFDYLTKYLKKRYPNEY